METDTRFQQPHTEAVGFAAAGARQAPDTATGTPPPAYDNDAASGESRAAPSARLKLWLPQTQAAHAVRVPAHALPAPGAIDVLHGMRILLVDDSLDTLEAFGALLELEGACPSMASSGAQALRLAAHHDFDLILSDLGMPGMDGFELVAELRRQPRTAHVPVFALSAMGDLAGIARALNGGFTAYIDKPVTLDALLHAIERTHVASRET